MPATQNGALMHAGSLSCDHLDVLAVFQALEMAPHFSCLRIDAGEDGVTVEVPLGSAFHATGACLISDPAAGQRVSLLVDDDRDSAPLEGDPALDYDAPTDL